jgi:hypothetical protein
VANWEFQWGGEAKSGYIGLMTAGETLGMGIDDLAAVAPLSSSSGTISLLNDALATITEIDTAALDTTSDVKIPTSKAVGTALTAKPDYTVGTWTPIYKPATGDNFASATYDIQEGFYIKVNAFYFCTFAMRTDAIDKGTATAGATVNVIGLPGVASARAYIGSFGMTMAFTTNNPTSGLISNTSQVISLYYGNSTSALTVANLGTGANSNFLAGQFLYKSS